MGILRLLIRGTREAVQEKRAKNDLERKLGRRVSKEDLYSLGAHLDAAQPAAAQMPLQSTPRESAVPFADAKPPMRRLYFWLIVGVLVLFVGTIGTAAFVAMMPERTYNRLNPFTPKPPAGSFPAQLGDYKLKEKPDYYGVSSLNRVPYFEGEYNSGTNYIKYTLWDYKTEADVKSAFEARKKYITALTKFQIVDNSDARYVVVSTPGNSNYVLFTDGTQLKQIYGYHQKSIYEFEGLLKNSPPAEVVAVNLEKLASDNNLSVTVLQLLDDYKKDSAAADKKYKGKTISVTGTVEVSIKDKKGNPLIGFLRPGSTNPADGMVDCSFDKSQEPVISKVKKGDSVKLQGKVFGNLLGNIMLENCTKQ